MQTSRLKNGETQIDECIEILNKGTSGVLALSGNHDYPYAIPISYVYCNSKLYFHGAKSGHKIDAINKCSKASFCVIDQDNIIPEEYTTYFRSVIAFGNIHIMENEIEIKKAIEDLAKNTIPPIMKQDAMQKLIKNVNFMHDGILY